MTDPEFTGLIPVSEWVWNLYQVRYLTKVDGRFLTADYFVSTETHIWDEADGMAPGDHCGAMQVNLIKEKVPAPGRDWVTAGRSMFDRLEAT